jgi:hypothetical protein
VLTQHDCIGMTPVIPSGQGRPASLLELGKDWQVIDTITTKVVLIVGHFTPELKTSWMHFERRFVYTITHLSSSIWRD